MGNILTRDEFKKLNEILVGEKGGPHDTRGFANDAKWKETLIGKLINGIFSPIGKLMKKGYDNFIINKLTAKLINEFLRGVFLFSVDKKIDLTSGKMTAGGEQSGTTAGTAGALDSQYDTSSGVTSGTTGTTSGLSGKTAAVSEEILEINGLKTPEEVQERKAELEKSLREDLNKRYSDAKGNFRFHERKYSEEKIEKNKEPIKKLLDKYAAQMKEYLDDIKHCKEMIALCDKRLAEMAGKGTTDDQEYINRLKAAIGDFDPTKPYQSETIDNFIDYPTFESKFHPLDVNMIMKKEYYALYKDGVRSEVVVEDVIPSRDEVSVKYQGKVENVKVTRLLPISFPDFTILNTMRSFLVKQSKQYGGLDEESKKLILNTTKEYLIINAIRNKLHKLGLETVNESLSEATVHQKVGMKRLDKEPEAGVVGAGRKVALAVGTSPTVGDVLTTRDKKKIKEEADVENIKIKDVNLAEISKTMKGMSTGNKERVTDGRVEASKYVNPYNLKMIALVADHHINKSGTPNLDFKNKWQKAVTRVNATFEDLLDIPSVDILSNKFESLDTTKVDKKVKALEEQSEAEKKICSVVDGFGAAIDEETPTLNKIAAQSFLISFEYQGYIYNVAAQSIQTNQNYKLFNMTKGIQIVSNQVSEDPQFLKVFQTRTIDNVPSTTLIRSVKTWFSIRTTIGLHKKREFRPVIFLVFNEFTMNDGSSKLCIYDKTGNNTPITEEFVNNYKSDKYLITLSLYSICEFLPDLSDANKKFMRFNEKESQLIDDNKGNIEKLTLIK